MASSPRHSPAPRNTPVYHIVAHTHWDREWYKPFEEFRARLVECVDALLEILKRDATFASFMLDGQASVLDDYLAIRPERKKELEKFIRARRIITGPWYTLPDEFLVSGEAIIRNLLIGSAIAKSFGHCMNIGYVPDSFGHAAAMPMIFRGFGMSRAVAWRGFGGEPGENISEWIWRAPDESAVLMHHLHRDGYSAATFYDLTSRETLARFRELQSRVDERATTPHRLLLSGGDHHFPDPNLPAIIRELRKRTAEAIRLSTLEDFFAGVEKSKPLLDVLDGELHFGYRNAFVVSSGVYSSRTNLKQQNFRIQKLFERYAEPLMALASLHGKNIDRALLLHGWKNLLRNHAHDSICGCSIDAVHDEMTTRFAKAEQVAQHLVNTSLEALVPQGKQSTADDASIVLFNPSPTTRSDIAKANVEFYLQDVVVGLNPDVRFAPKFKPSRGLQLRDAHGSPVRFQIVKRGEAYGISESRYDYPKQSRVDKFELLIEAKKLPALSLTNFSASKSNALPKFKTSLRVQSRSIENNFIKLFIQPNGAIDLLDKKSGARFSNLHFFEDGGDVGDEYSYSFPKKDRIVTSTRAIADVRIVERGPLRACLVITATLRIPQAASSDKQSRAASTHNTKIISRVEVYEDSPVVQIETSFTNASRDHRLRAVFPLELNTSTSFADQHFSVVRREHKSFDTKEFTIEHPSPVHAMQRFVTIQDGHIGLTLLSDGLPEYEWRASDGTLALTLLRCVGQLSGSDLLTRPGGDAGWKNETPGAQCIGDHTLRYGIVAHAANVWEKIENVAEKFHAPLLATTRKNISKNISGVCSIEHPAIRLSALKPSERGNAIVLRLVNTSNANVDCTLALHKNILRVVIARMDETLERAVAVRRGAAALQLTPHEVVTLVLYRNTRAK